MLASIETLIESTDSLRGSGEQPVAVGPFQVGSGAVAAAGFTKYPKKNLDDLRPGEHT